MEYSNVKTQDTTNPLSTRQHNLVVPIIDHEISSSSTCASALSSALRNGCARVPRPTNAFMIYANENRKCLAKQFPLDSNKEISKRLGHCWKDLEPERKAVYYTLAKQVDADHKKKYPNYVYNPKEARIRKALRDATREKMLGVGAGLVGNGAQMRPSGGGQRRLAQPWMLPDQQDDQIMMSPSEPGGPAGGALRAGMASPMCGTGFPMSMAPIGSYASQMHHPHAAYMNNPLAQLQQQTDLWSPYHHKSQTKSPQDGPYLMSSHHHHHMQSVSSSSSSSSPYTSHAHATLAPPMTSFSPSHPDDNKTADSQQQDGTPLHHSSSSPSVVVAQLSPGDTPAASTPTALTATKMEQPDDDTASEQSPALMGDGGAMTSFDSCRESSSASMDRANSTPAGFQEKIVLQNPFDVTPNNNDTPTFHKQQQQQQQHRKKQPLIVPIPLIPPNSATGGAGDTTAITYRIAEVEIRKQFILKYAENYNYDHMELMLQQQSSNVAQGRAVSYHYVTLPTISCPGPGDVVNLPISQSQVASSAVGQLGQEMYLVNGGPIGQVNQALNLTTDLK